MEINLIEPFWLAVIGTSLFAFLLKILGHSVPKKWLSNPRILKINGTWIDTVKSPITSPDKKSKGGRFDNLNLSTYYHNGKLLIDDNLDTIRSRLII